jgi:hypothetical protein
VSPQALAGDDVVRTRDEVAEGAREPLIVLEPLARWLDARGRSYRTWVRRNPAQAQRLVVY